MWKHKFFMDEALAKKWLKENKKPLHCQKKRIFKTTDGYQFFEVSINPVRRSRVQGEVQILKRLSKIEELLKKKK